MGQGADHHLGRRPLFSGSPCQSRRLSELDFQIVNRKNPRNPENPRVFFTQNA
jgi:hypothetical protein